ncbi:MAG: CCA tRNA nucleotidyltransferase [Deltaproteobacteria bacterium]|nr:CCA tRNA nucleotidyltransferase [Deltaproteobacteria bacterium]
MDPQNLILKRRDLPHFVAPVIHALSEIVQGSRLRVFLVGGFVRDLLLGGSLRDMDVVTEGNSGDLARQLAGKVDGKVHSHGEFETYAVFLAEGTRIDIAMARRESYLTPAALPQVEPGTMEQDLQRRDFTINAIAIEVQRGGLGDFMDPYQGEKDLRSKKIQALHEKSFVEDPTRIFRALRYQYRFGFSLESKTAQWMEQSIQQRIPALLSGKRLFTELKKMAEEKDPLPLFKALEQWKLFSFFDSSIRFGKDETKALRRLKEALKWAPSEFEASLTFLLLILSRLSEKKISAQCREWSLPRRWEKAVLQSKEATKVARSLNRPRLKPSQVYRILAPYELEPLLLFDAQGERRASQWIQQFICELRKTQIHTTGEELKRLGIPPGPSYKKILGTLRDLTLDGKMSSPVDEEAYLKGLL